jgi:uncharacterized protein
VAHFYHLLVHVIPRSSRDEIAGWQDGVLRVRLRAQPVEGQANESLRRLLARRLGLPVSNIELVGSTTSRTKRLRISGLTEGEVQARLP